MGYIIRLGIILMVVSGLGAGALALVNLKTKPIIEDYKRVEEARARAEVMEAGKKFVLCDSASALPFYKVFADEEGTQLIGYVFTAEGKGYSSTVKTVAGVDTAFNLVGIKVTSQQETPGLGAKCQEITYGEDDSWFQRQFFSGYYENRGESPLNALTIAVDKDGGKIHSITGATITGRAIANSIKQAASEIKVRVEG